MKKLHPKINEAACILQSWVDAGMAPDVMRERLACPGGIVANLCCEAAGAKPVGGSVSAQLVVEVAVDAAGTVTVSPEARQLLEGDRREMELSARHAAMAASDIALDNEDIEIEDIDD